MFAQAAISNFFTVILGFSAVGYVLDQITKKLRTDRELSNLAFDFKQTLEIYFEASHLRFLGDHPLRKKFLINGAILYVLLLSLLAVSMTKKMDVDLFNYFLAPFPVLFAAYFGGFLIFLLSLFQTQVFVKASVKSDSTPSRLVYIATDLLVSSNVFVFLFSFFLVLGSLLAWQISETRRTGSELDTIVVDYKVSKVAERNILGDFYPAAFRHDIQVRPKVGSTFLENTGAVKFRVFSAKPFIPVSALIPNNLVSSDKIEVFFGQTSVSIPISEIDEKFKTLSYGHSEHSAVTTYTLVGGLNPIKLHQFNVFYTSAFQQVDRIEDQFIELFSSRSLLGADPAHVLRIEASYTPFFTQRFCTINGKLISARALGFAAASTRNWLSCVEEVEVVSGVITNIRNLRASALIDDFRHDVLLSPVYLTVMVPSILFYLVLTSIVVMRLCRKFLSETRIGIQIYRTVPFSFAFLLMGTIFWFGLVA